MIAAAVVHVHPVAAVVIHHGARLLARQVTSWVSAILSRRPSVTVVTPTWLRRRLLTGRCVPSVRAQTYAGAVGHVIVSDGPDESLSGLAGVRFLPAHVAEGNRGLTARRRAGRYDGLLPPG